MKTVVFGALFSIVCLNASDYVGVHDDDVEVIRLLAKIDTTRKRGPLHDKPLLLRPTPTIPLARQLKEIALSPTPRGGSLTSGHRSAFKLVHKGP